MIDEAAVALRYAALAPVLDERGRRRFAAAEAQTAGRGGVLALTRITGLARSTIDRGLRELAGTAAREAGSGRVRRPGGGRKKLTETDPTLLADLQNLVEPTTRGDPMAPLLWTSRSLRNLADALQVMGHRIKHNVVADLLRQLDYSLQSNRKTREGSNNPDRDAQFEYINSQMKAALTAGQPAISVDTKNKELVGDFKNAGRELRPKGQPMPVRVHDFRIPELGRAVPYGVHDITANTGWVSVGVDHDTASFAVNAIRSWWRMMGQARHPDARYLLITADCGGSNGARVRLRKRELQSLADELGLTITVCHLPPGTSKWNKIDHRLFSFITQNWRGKPPVDYQAIVQLIASTITRTGLNVKGTIDPNAYPAAVKVTDAEMAALNLKPHEFHGEWNRTIAPKPP
ncbi:MAG TPA: ISAzo13 family transposase [Acetobacteraceae bacterium]|nr:ISAzo13 family transposase [Acetobacteraceae bacterium]